MKTAEELNALKNEVEALNKKLAELSEEDLTQVVGGAGDSLPDESKDESSQKYGPKQNPGYGQGSMPEYGSHINPDYEQQYHHHHHND